MARAASAQDRPGAAVREAALPRIAEVFRLHGYEGTTLSQLTQATGLGKGSLYNFFPGGKKQMAAEVLAEIDGWFEHHVFDPLRDCPASDVRAGIARMFDSVDDYFRSGRRVCLVGLFALGSARDSFEAELQTYFKRWRDALALALRHAGCGRRAADNEAEAVLLEIQGALVLSRALDDPGVFSRSLRRLRDRRIP